MQICLNNFQRNLVKMAERFVCCKHFELACEQPAVGKERGKEKGTVGMAKDFDFRMLVIHVVFKLTIFRWKAQPHRDPSNFA